MMFACGRPALMARLSMMQDDWRGSIEETEYTPHWDMLRHRNRDFVVVPSNEANRFRPTLEDHCAAFRTSGKIGRQVLLRSNPGAPPGVALTAAACNRMLLAQKAAILPGELCDMLRRGEKSPLATFIRVSFGPGAPEEFEGDMAVLKQAIRG